ncbi:ABC transporter ATP-binding protein [Aerococcaceae bacterium WGS1372]
MNESIVLEVKNLSKSYGKQLALSEFNLKVKKGEIVGIAGPNGAGKTTLFRIITGMTPTYKGNVHLFGSLDETGLRENRQFLGTIIEDPAFFPEMTAQQNLEFYRLQRGVKDKERTKKLLKLVGLADVGKKRFRSFSLGMKQRLAIALALLQEPDIVIFDEPTNGLDPKGIIQVRQLLHQLAEETNLTIIVSSHILSELEHLATRFVIMNHGQKIEEFTKQELKDKLQAHYELGVDDTTKAINLLKEKYEHLNVQVNSDGFIEIFNTSIEATDISDLMFQHQIRLFHLVLKSHNLEEIFISLTEEAVDHDSSN